MIFTITSIVLFQFIKDLWKTEVHEEENLLVPGTHCSSEKKIEEYKALNHSDDTDVDANGNKINLHS